MRKCHQPRIIWILYNLGNGEEGSGTPLQYSCLENPMDRGAWWAAVHGVTKSQTWLSDFPFTFMHWRRKRQPTPVFLPGESQGREPGGLLSMGSHGVGHDWSDLAVAGNGRPKDGKQSHVAKGREAVSGEVSSPYLIIKWHSAKELLKIFPIFVFWKRQLYTQFGLPWWLSSEESACNAGAMDRDRGAWWVSLWGHKRRSQLCN